MYAIEDASELSVLRLESRLSQEKRGAVRAASPFETRDVRWCGRSFRAQSEWASRSPFEEKPGPWPQLPVKRVCSSKAWRPTSESEGAGT